MTLYTGNALDILKTLPDNSCDSLVTDPPAGIAFMGRDWDTDKGGRKQWVAWLTEILVEAYRVLKPGAHGLVWALPRTAHWTGWAIEDAGFEIRDNIVNHINGQGFPKSLNVGKSIDKAAGAEREAVGWKVEPDGRVMGTEPKAFARICNPSDKFDRKFGADNRTLADRKKVTAPATPDAEQWEGWGSALKPSQEIWWLVRKPLSEKTVAANVLKHGTGALNIDATRLATSVSDAKAMERVNSPGSARLKPSEGYQGSTTFRINRDATDTLDTSKGRWPSNVMFSHVEGKSCPDCTGDDSACPTCQGTGEVGGCRRVGTQRVKASYLDHKGGAFGQHGVYSKGTHGHYQGYADPDGKETVEAWECVPGCCPVAQLDAQSGLLQSGTVSPHHMRNNSSQPSRGGYEGGFQDAPLTGFGDSGGASRFFYCPKASTKERYFYCRTCDAVYSRKAIKEHAGHDLFQHPTQKPLALMEYLVRMITPPGGTVLDPFCGTGTTGVAANTQGFAFVGIDLDADAIRVASYRTAVAKPEKTIFSLFDTLT